VLVAGGYDGVDQLASTERYDPVRNVWSPAAAMAVPRDAHGAAGLAGGKVLVMGGECATGVLGGAELYDPGEGPGRGDGWIPQAQLLLARAQPCAVALADGRVLVACGRNLGSMLSSPELFRPGGGAWVSAGGGDARARSAHTATLLGDGTVLVAGGSADAQAIAGAQRFDPVAQSWRDTGNPLAQARMNHTATLLQDGATVAVFGGEPLQANLEIWK
jgi:hypothetical protein